MQSFEVIWLQWLFVMVITGLGMALLFFLGFYVAARPGRPDEKEEIEQYPQGIQARRGRIPAVMWILYIGIAVFIIAYITWMSVSKASF